MAIYDAHSGCGRQDCSLSNRLRVGIEIEKEDVVIRKKSCILN